MRIKPVVSVLLMVALLMTTEAAAQTIPEGLEGQAKGYVMSFADNDGAALSREVVVVVDGSDVYMQGLSRYFPEAWVKGTKDGSLVTFAARQYMGKRGTYGTSYLFCDGDKVFTYDAEADTYSAVGVIYGMLAGVYYDGYYKNPFLRQVDDRPATPATPAISDVTSDVYAWYMTISVPATDTEGNALLPSKLSYQFFVDVEHQVTPLTFTPDTHIRLTEDMTAVPYGFTDGYDFFDTKVYLDDLYTDDFNRIGIQSIYAGGGEEHRSEISWFTLRDYDDEGIDPPSEVVPDDPIDIHTAELPYSNDFSDQQKSELVVLDANGDGNTWGFSAGVAFYSYSESKAANDWLVTPRLPLKAGSKYRVSLKAAAQSSSYPEKFEVKAAKGTADTAATMAALLSAGTTVIPATTVSNYTFSTFENESFTVAEDDYYNIGIHVISPALRWVFTVKDFLVEETDAAGVYTMPHAPSTMPNEVYDLQGRRVSGAVANSSFFTLHSSLKKGLYIVNGKKVVLK